MSQKEESSLQVRSSCFLSWSFALKSEGSFFPLGEFNDDSFCDLSKSEASCKKLQMYLSRLISAVFSLSL